MSQAVGQLFLAFLVCEFSDSRLREVFMYIVLSSCHRLKNYVNSFINTYMIATQPLTSSERVTSVSDLKLQYLKTHLCFK